MPTRLNEETYARVLQPGTGFTTKPGVAAVRRTPGQEMGIAPNPNGVPQLRMLNLKRKMVLAMWNPVGVQAVLFRNSWGAPLSRRPQALL